MAKLPRYPLPDFGDVIFLLIFYFLLFTVPKFVFGDGSTGWHLVTGQFILNNHIIPHTDLFSYTHPGAPWVAYEWLSDLCAAAAERLAGLNGVAIAASAIIASIFLLLYERCRRCGMNFPLAVFLIVVASLASSIHWLARPHIFTFLGVYIFATVLEDFHRGRIGRVRLLAVLASSMVLWVNLHPGFLLGFALIAIYLCCELVASICLKHDAGGSESLRRAKWFAIALVELFVVTLANPYSFNLYRYIAHYLGNSQIIYITNEFASPVFHGGVQATCLEVVFLFVVLSLAITRVRPSFPQLITCLAFAHLALSGVRNSTVFVIVALPFIADLIRDVRLPFNGQRMEGQEALWMQVVGKRWRAFCQSFDEQESLCQMHILPVAAVVLVWFASVTAGAGSSKNLLDCGFNPNTMPTATLSYIQGKKLPPAHGFNFDNWGGYIYYRLGMPVFIDDRLDFYGKKFFLDYGKIVQLEPGWSDLLDRYRINWIIFPKNSPLCQRLRESQHWRLACEDKAADLFVRND